jgi:hypothetical protein
MEASSYKRRLQVPSATRCISVVHEKVTAVPLHTVYILLGQRCSYQAKLPATQCGQHLGFPSFLNGPVKRRHRELIEGAQHESESSESEETEQEVDNANIANSAITRSKSRKATDTFCRDY